MPRALLLTFALLSLLSCSPGSRGSSPDARTSAQPAGQPKPGVVTASELEAGERLVGRIATAMGGWDAIGSIRTLSLDGTMTRPAPSRQQVPARVTTRVKFPNLYRQEVHLPVGKVTTLIGPSGAWMLAGGDTPLPVPEERRLEIENIILRNPVALLKTKGSELFSAVGVTPPAGAPAGDHVRISVGTKESTIRLGPEGLIETISYELPGAKDTRPPRLTVHYSDYRKVGPILYPFSSSAEANGSVTYRLQLDSVKANEPLPGTLFVPDKIAKGN